MPGIEVKQKGGFANISKFFTRMRKNHFLKRLDQYGQLGCQELANATPIRTGKTALSWDYEIETDDAKTTLTWLNTNTSEHINIAYILDKGHATGSGGYVPGLNFIEPSLSPVMERMSKEHWKEVKSS